MKACTKMTAAELAAATAEYDKPVAPKSLRPMSAPERVKWKNAIRGPGRPRIGKGAVNALISFEMGLLSRADVFATSHAWGAQNWWQWRWNHGWRGTKRRRRAGGSLDNAAWPTSLIREFMSHHFDTPTAREDPRINVSDFYLFDGTADTTVMAMTVNPDAGLSAPDTFRDEGLYAFRFDLNGDGREELTFKFRFGDPRHAHGDDHRHVQNFTVLKAGGDDALRGLGGELLIEGETGVAINKSAVRVFAGTAPDLFAGDAAGLRGFMGAFLREKKFHPEAFANRQNFFDRRNVSAIVLEVPNHLIGAGIVAAWATASLIGHAPEVQVSRWGLPLLTHIFLNDPSKPELPEDYNRALPTDDVARFAAPIAEFAEKMTTLARSARRPAEFGKRLAAKLCPTTLPYQIGTTASFDYTGFNGRALEDDVMDVMLTLATNTPLGDGVRPDPRRIRKEFPYFGEPFTPAEQAGVTPAGHPKKN